MPHRPASAHAFDTTATGYDASRRQLIPCFDEFYATALALLSEVESPDGRLRIVDLGAGTGVMSAMILDNFPSAHLTLIDAAENMLAFARERLESESHRVEFVVADFLEHSLGGPYDAVVSGLAIHHLEHADKRTLFGRIHEALRPGGRFINADQARGATEEIEKSYYQRWLRQVKENQVSEEALAAAIGRMRYDITAPLDQQLAWVAGAGFEAVSCGFDGDMFVVYSGWRG